MKLGDLERPFPADRIHWRVGATNGEKTKGIALAYIDARDVMDRLDDVCPGKWQATYVDAGNGKTCCQIGIKVDGEWLWRGNGAGETDFEADKGAFSDSFKRAAVLWGICRYLYRIESPWVEIEPRGKSYVIAEKERGKLAAIIDKTIKVYIPREVKNEFYTQAKEFLSNGDENGMREIWSEWDGKNDERLILWSMFNSQERSAMKAMQATA